jgi:hypothetical protein
MKDSDIIKQFREKFPQGSTKDVSIYEPSEPLDGKPTDIHSEIESFILSILHQDRQELIERVKALAYSETEDMTATELLIMDSYNNAIKDVVSDIEALLKVKE